MKHIKRYEVFSVKPEYNPDEIGSLKELILTASKIIGKQLSLYEQDKETTIKEITDFIETNIQNKKMEKNIDILTDIKKQLKK